ncbi:MAG: rod shape-determining protein MreC [Flavobacteriales bacterium]
MQNLFSFLKRFQVFLVFFLFQILCFALYIQFVSYPNSVFLSTASSINGKVTSWTNAVKEPFSIKDNNAVLRAENATLRKQLSGNIYPLARTTTYVNDTINHLKFNYIPTEVVNNNVTRRNNYFTIDVGSIQQITPGMAVITPRGVLGVVFKVGKRFSLVKTVLTQDINLDVMIEKTGAKGILKWHGSDPLRATVTGVPDDLKIPIGSKVSTLDVSGMFPKGIPVGTVEKIAKMENQPLWNITIRFSEDYRTLHGAYLVKSFIKNELKEIQSEIPKEPTTP